MQPSPAAQQDLLCNLYPMLGGGENVAAVTRRGHRFSITLKDQSLADTDALAALPVVANWLQTASCKTAVSGLN